MAPTLIAAWTLAGLLALGGLLALLLPGSKVSDAPHCRRCSFDLAGWAQPLGKSSGEDPAGEGQRPGPTRCPECGGDLSRPRAIRQGLRRRSRRRLAVGASLCVLGAGGLTALGWGTLQHFQWNSVKPAWLLVLEGASSDQAVAEPALKELAQRAAKGALSKARLAALAREGLLRQADTSRPWIFWWGDLIERAALEGLLSDAELLAYARRAFTFSLAGPAKLRQGDTFVVRLRAAGERSPRRAAGAVSYYAKLATLRLDEQPLDPPETTITLTPGPHTAEAGNFVQADDLPTGTHTLRATARVHVYKGLVEGVYPGAVASTNRPMAIPEGALDVLNLELSRTVEVVPADQPLVPLAPDPALAPKLQQLLRIEKVVVSKSAREGEERVLTIYVAAPRPMKPVNLAMAIFVRAQGREIRLDKGVVIPRNTGGSWGDMAALPEWFDADEVDVALRTDPKVAREHGLLEEVWDGELLYERVPVEWDVPRPGAEGKEPPSADGASTSAAP